MPNRPPRPALGFSGQKVFAWAEGCWRECPHGECRRRGKCTGGPRGTMRKHGKPLCRQPAMIEAIAARSSYRARQRAIHERDQALP